MGASVTTSRGSCPGGGRKNFLPGLWLKILWTVYLPPGLLKRDVVTPAPRKVHSGKQAAGVAAEGLTAPSGAVALHTVRCAGERRFRRDRGAARPERSLQALVFQTSDRSGSPKPRQRVRRRLAGAPAAACRSRA